MYDLNNERARVMVIDVWRFGMVIGKPTFVPVQDLEMGFEKMVKIAHSSGGTTRNFKPWYVVPIYISHSPTNCSIQTGENWRKIESWGVMIDSTFMHCNCAGSSFINENNILMWEFCFGFEEEAVGARNELLP